MTTVVVSQPMLFPWPGFFEQLMLADVYLFLDDVQFSKGSFTNRVQVRLGNESKWMTIPLASKGAFQRISELRDNGTDWRKSHRDLLRQALRGAPYLSDALSLVDACYAEQTICDVLIASVEKTAQYLRVGTGQRRQKTSSMNIGGESWMRVLELVRAIGGTRYLTGHGAANYLDHAAFEESGVAVEYMAYSLKPWPRAVANFTPYVTILDLIAHTGPAARNYLEPSTQPWHSFLAKTTSH